MNNENQLNSHRYPTDPLESLRKTIVFGAKDWSEDKRDAWIYGIVVGWNDESLSELSIKYRWSEEHVQRLKQLNQAFKRLQQKKRKVAYAIKTTASLITVTMFVDFSASQKVTQAELSKMVKAIGCPYQAMRLGTNRVRRLITNLAIW